MASLSRDDGSQLRIETEPIEITSLGSQPDKNWRYTDKAGHRHHWEDGYPTLTTVVEPPYWCEDCHDEHQDSHFECSLCGERIAPGVTCNPWREFTVGRVNYYLDDEPITKERAEEIMRERGL